MTSPSIPVYRFLEENFLTPEYREACYFISDLIKVVSDRNDTVVKASEGRVYVTIVDYSMAIDMYLEEGMIVGLEFHKLVFHAYDYFMKDPRKQFFRQTLGDDLDHIKKVLITHIEQHDNVHMFALLKELS
jgi:hypothetical protein